MTIDMQTIDDFLFSATYSAKKNEIDKAKEISEQLIRSIEWLKYEAGNEKDHQKKNDLLMEAEAAKREFVRINREINKVEKAHG